MTRTYKAPLDLVWSVWTDPAHVAAWWGPFGPEKTSCKIDLKVGGWFDIAMQAPDGTHYPSRGIIRELDPPSRLVIEGDPAAPDACGAGLPPKAFVTLQLEEVASGTKLTIETRFMTVDARDAANESGFSTSWNETLDGLVPYVENLKGE
jgi:uncharacterized protein YndB with AHSA1/START domain